MSFSRFQELPDWRIANKGWLAAPEGEGQWSAYERKDSKSQEPWGKFTHYLFLFDTLEAAQVYYLNPTIPLSETGSWLEEISYRPDADEMLMRCLPINEEGLSYYTCEWWARYGQQVTKVEANVFEQQWLTAGQFEQLLQAIDGRMRAGKKVS